MAIRINFSGHPVSGFELAPLVGANLPLFEGQERPVRLLPAHPLGGARGLGVVRVAGLGHPESLRGAGVGADGALDPRPRGDAATP